MTWTNACLQDLFNIGSSKRVLKSQWRDAGVPFYRGREVTKLSQNGSVDNDLFIDESLYVEFKDKYGVPKEGDIVITAIGTIGNSYVVGEGDRFYFKDASVLWLDKKSDVDSCFINYWIGSPFFRSQLGSNGATVDTLTIGKLKSTRINLPALAEQKRIVAILDEAFEGIDTAIANTEKNLANSKELFESYLNSVFNQQGKGWRIESVSDFSHHCLGKMLDKQKNKGELSPYLRNINVQWFEVGTEDILEMRIEHHEQERFLVKKGDLLICEGGYPGRAAIWEKAEPIYFQKALHRVRCKDPRLNKWLLYYLFLLDATGALRPHFTGAGIQHFTGRALKAFAVPLPPEELVDELLKGIESIHEEVRRLESIYQQKLTALTELKQSLLQKAFSGELTAGLVKVELACHDEVSA